MIPGKDAWTVAPGHGLGALHFGMAPEQVDELSGTYGLVTGRREDRIPDPILRETLEKFGDAMSDQEKQDLLDLYTELAPPAESVTETRGDPGLILHYRAARLVEIMTAGGHHPLLLDGVDLLSVSPQRALALLERLNGGLGTYAKDSVTFDKLRISATGFSTTEPGGAIRPLNEADERFADRTVTLHAPED